jgi:hypothetical protein
VIAAGVAGGYVFKPKRIYEVKEYAPPERLLLSRKHGRRITAPGALPLGRSST